MNSPPPNAAPKAAASASGSTLGALGAAGQPASTLMDLLFDAFYMVSLLRNGYAPQDAETFRERVRGFLIHFERGTLQLGTRPEDVSACKFAFCALLDEIILGSALKVRDTWERRPLQLEYFGNQLGGEKFYDDLEALRQQGIHKIQVLEVFHMCLLMGFKGKYILEGSEKLGYLTARLGDEMAQLKGSKAAFAPHWAAPDRVAHALRSELPLWVLGAVFALMGLLGFVGIKWALNQQTQRELGAMSNLVQMAPEVAHITITLP